MTTKSKKTWKPAEWQTNPENIKTAKCQYWTKGGTMITAEMTNATAKELIKSGSAYIISEQAIGEL